MRKTIVLDTNFLMIPGQFGIDIFLELDRRTDFPYKVAVLRGTLYELDEIIEKDKNKHKIAARIAKALVKAKNLKIEGMDRGLGVDDMLVRLSHRGYIVATLDRELRRRLNKPFIVMKQKKYLEMVR